MSATYYFNLLTHSLHHVFDQLKRCRFSPRAAAAQVHNTTAGVLQTVWLADIRAHVERSRAMGTTLYAMAVRGSLLPPSRQTPRTIVYEASSDQMRPKCQHDFHRVSCRS